MSITVKFLGICTHLIATHKHLKVPSFTLTAGDGSPVLHRVVLPNSDLIATHINPARPVLPHIPKLRVEEADMTDDLAKLMTKHGTFYDMPLKELALGFDNVDDTGPTDYWKDLAKIPHIWDMTPGHPSLRKSVMNGWSNHASAYIDFTTGVKFKVKETPPDNNVDAEIKFKDQPQLSIRHRNDKQKTPCKLKDGMTLTISDLPVANCCNWDYLLNYFVTTLDLCEETPQWPDPKRPNDKEGNATDYGVGTEVYCSSSGYP